MAVKRNYVNQVYGLSSPTLQLSPKPIFADVAPTSSDRAEVGTMWVYKVSSSLAQIYILTPIVGWVELETNGGSGVFSSLLVSGATILNGALTVASGTDAINISADAAATSVNLATGAGAKTLVIGSTNTTSSTTINSGTGGIALASTSTGDITLNSSDTCLIDAAGVLELNSSAGVISIGNDAVAQNINIATGAAARVVTIGNVTGATAVNVNSGTGGVVLNSNSTGKISIVSAPVSVAATTVTNDSLVGSSTLTGLTTASGATETITFNNSLVTASNCVLVSASNLNASTNGAAIGIESIVQANGSLSIVLKNNGGGALGAGDDVHIAHMILG